MGKFEGNSQKNFKWWWENLGKFEEKLENFDTNWKTSEKDGKFEVKLENFETKPEDLEKIQKSREKWEKTSNETRKFWGEIGKNFWQEKERKKKVQKNGGKISKNNNPGKNAEKKNPRKKIQENIQIFFFGF